MNKKSQNMLFVLLIAISNLIAIPEFEILINDNPYQEHIFIHSMGSDYYMTILDSNFDIYWQINSNQIGLDFKENNNQISYFDKNINDNQQPYWIIANKQMQETDSLICTSGVTDYHDIRLLENGNYIIQSYDSLYVDMSVIIDGGNSSAKIKSILRLQEFDSNHSLIFDWFAFDHLNIADYNNLNLTNAQIVWMHGNSIDIDLDENIIVSNRRSSEVIKIDRITGEIIWILGGPTNDFEIINDPLNGFSKQHDARRLTNGNLLLFDNGNNHQPPLSRVIEYEINEIDKTATLVWEFQQPDELVALSMGSCQRLPNQNTLINWGNIAGIKANIMEVDYEKNIVLELQYLNHNAYKVRKSSWEFDIPMLIGDTNLDEIINILDVIYLVNYILLEDVDSHSIFNLYKIDLNKDNLINILDAVEIINLILN